MIIEIEEIDKPTSMLSHQILTAIFLYVYSVHWGYVKNGLENNASAVPIKFIVIACMTGRRNSIIYTAVAIIGIIIAKLLIDYAIIIKFNSNIKKFFDRPFSHKAKLFINKSQKALELEIPSIKFETIQKLIVIAYYVQTEIMDVYVMMVQHNMYDSTLLEFLANLLRRYIRGVSLTFLCVAIATDVIKKCITELQISTNKIRRLEIGPKSRTISYIVLSTIVIADDIISSHEVITIIGIIGLSIYGGLIFIVKFTNLASTRLENQDLENAIAPGSNFLQSATAQSIYCNPQSPYGQQIRQRHSATPVSCNKSSQYFTMQCNHQGTLTSHRIINAI